MSSIDIRPITEVEDALKVEIIQKETWGMPDVEVFPGRFLHALQQNGACFLGAYDGDRIVGFVIGVLGTVEGLDHRIDQIAAARLQMYSAIMGVIPEYQSTNIGYRLKLAQREFALRIGVRLIKWTFDPLESRNGYFNIGKLGVVCNHYVRNFHGPMSGINAGLPTDRFDVEWWVTSSRVATRLSDKRGPLSLDAYLTGGATLINETTRDKDGFRVPPDDYIDSSSQIVLVEIPADMQAIKRHNMDLAMTWRMHGRRLFEACFQKGYLATDFVRHKDGEGRARSFYSLTLSDTTALAGNR